LRIARAPHRSEAASAIRVAAQFSVVQIVTARGAVLEGQFFSEREEGGEGGVSGAGGAHLRGVAAKGEAGIRLAAVVAVRGRGRCRGRWREASESRMGVEEKEQLVVTDKAEVGDLVKARPPLLPG